MEVSLCDELMKRRKVISLEVKELKKDQKIFLATSLVMGSLGSFVLVSSYMFKEIMGTKSIEYALGALLVLSAITIGIMGNKAVDKEELKALKEQLKELDDRIQFLTAHDSKQLKKIYVGE